MTMATHAQPAATAGMGSDGVHGSAEPPLAMSPRPSVTIAHPRDDAARQHAGALHAALPAEPWAAIGAVVPWLRDADPARCDAATKARLVRLVDAVRDELGLPAVVAIATEATLPQVTMTTDPLLALGLLVRRSGPAWLAGRIPAFEGLAAGSAVTLLLPPRLLETVVRRTTDPGWRTAVLARAAQPEVNR